jgi:hypothetical protein
MDQGLRNGSANAVASPGDQGRVTIKCEGGAEKTHEKFLQG